MCVICIKEMGRKFPSEKAIKNCADANPDGFAMMWNEKDGRVHNYKTIVKSDFLDFYGKFIKKHNYKKTAVVIHTRIKTHGSLRLENCHCWTALDDTIGFAHNGILSVSNRGDLTDSETFFRDIFVPVWEWSGRDWKVAERAIDAVIDKSKFAFLLGNGTIRHYGHYTKHEGCLYSNSSYEDKVYYSSWNYDDGGSTYSGKWNSDDWAYNYYKTKRYMYADGRFVYQNAGISDERWRLMIEHYFGKMTEAAYLEAIAVLPAPSEGSTEEAMNAGEIIYSDTEIFREDFESIKEWEYYILKINGHGEPAMWSSYNYNLSDF